MGLVFSILPVQFYGNGHFENDLDIVFTVSCFLFGFLSAGIYFLPDRRTH